MATLRVWRTDWLEQTQSGPEFLLRAAVLAIARGYRLTSTVTFVVADVPPPDAVTVIVWLPVDAEFDADTFIVVVPAADSELGENVTVSPLPMPEAENVTVPVVVPESVIVELPDDPRVTVSELGEAEIL
jgi:hypothetical protein